jgi:hypothetical protein
MTKITIPFIREEGLKGITTIAVVQFTLTKKMTSEQAIKALTDCLTKWVKETDEGHKAWMRSTADFNIGDLALYQDTFKATIKHSTLTAKGIIDFEFLYFGELNNTVNFDRVLVNQKELPDDYHLEQ